MTNAVKTGPFIPGTAAGAAGANPNLPPLAAAMAASFPTPEAAATATAALADAGVSADEIAMLTEQRPKYDLLKQYLHRDSDRHRHAGVGMAFFGSAGAGVLAALTLVFVNPLQTGWAGAIAIGVVGGVVGAVILGFLGGFALRSADDQSVELLERISRGGPLVVVRRQTDLNGVPFEEIGRILEREGGRTIRLSRRLTQADRHPGDTRSSDVTDPLNQRPGVTHDSP